MPEDKQDPLEGFHFTNYNAATQRITIELDPRVLRNPRSIEKLQEHAEAIIKAGSIDAVDFKARGT